MQSEEPNTSNAVLPPNVKDFTIRKGQVFSPEELHQKGVICLVPGATSFTFLQAPTLFWASTKIVNGGDVL